MEREFDQWFRNHRVPTLSATSSAIITSLLRTRYEVLRASIDHRSRLRYRGQVLLKEISERDAMRVRSHRTSRRGRRRPFGEEGEKAAEREKSRARCLQGERLLSFFFLLVPLVPHFLRFSRVSPSLPLFSFPCSPAQRKREAHERATIGRNSCWWRPREARRWAVARGNVKRVRVREDSLATPQQ